MSESKTFVPTGELRLSFRKKQSGKTYIAKQYYALPLQVLPPYYQDGDGTAFTYLLNPTGGVLQGDRLYTGISVEKGAKVLLTTTSANKLYKMEDDHAEIINEFTVEEDGVLEFIPEYNIPYAHSSVYQDSIFSIHKRSTLIAWDMVIPGRVDRGEYFDYKLYSSKIKIYVAGKPEAYEYSKLKPEKGSLAGIGVLEGYDIYASIFIYQENLPAGLKEDIQKTWEKADNVTGGVSYVSESLACVKLLGKSVCETRDVMTDIWDQARKNLLGKRKVRIRK